MSVTATIAVETGASQARGRHGGFAFWRSELDALDLQRAWLCGEPDGAVGLTDWKGCSVAGVSGSVTRAVPGKRGSGIQLSGGTITDAGLSLGDAFAMSLWFSHDAWDAGPILLATVHAEQYFAIQVSAVGITVMAQNGPGVTAHEVHEQLLMGQYHLVVIRTGTHCDVWLDGVHVIDSDDISWSVDLSGAVIEIGGSLGPTVTLDEIYVFGQALQPQHVDLLYNSGSGRFWGPFSRGASGAMTANAAYATGYGYATHGGIIAATARSAQCLAIGSLAAAPTTHSGTAALTAGAATVAASGARTVKGTGAVTATAAQCLAVGSLAAAPATHTGTGAVAAEAATISGAGARTVKGTAAATAGSASVLAIGPLTPAPAEHTGTIAVAAEAATAAGSGVRTITGTVAATASRAQCLAVGSLAAAPATHPGTATATAAAATLAATGARTITGAGALTSSVATASATGLAKRIGTAAVTASAAECSAIGLWQHTGIAAVTASAAECDASGLSVRGGTSEVTASAAVVMATGVRTVTGTGAATASAATASGTGVVARGGAIHATATAAECYGAGTGISNRQLYRVVRVTDTPGSNAKTIYLEAIKKPLWR